VLPHVRDKNKRLHLQFKTLISKFTTHNPSIEPLQCTTKFFSHGIEAINLVANSQLLEPVPLKAHLDIVSLLDLCRCRLDLNPQKVIKGCIFDHWFCF